MRCQCSKEYRFPELNQPCHKWPSPQSCSKSSKDRLLASSSWVSKHYRHLRSTSSKMLLSSRTKLLDMISETMGVTVHPEAIWKEVIHLLQVRRMGVEQIQKSTREKARRRWRCSRGLKDLRSLTSSSRQSLSLWSLICWKVLPKLQISKTRRLRLNLRWILTN